jgi:hypothetical protein
VPGVAATFFPFKSSGVLMPEFGRVASAISYLARLAVARLSASLRLPAGGYALRPVHSGRKRA